MDSIDYYHYQAIAILWRFDASLSSWMLFQISGFGAFYIGLNVVHQMIIELQVAMSIV